MCFSAEAQAAVMCWNQNHSHDDTVQDRELWQQNNRIHTRWKRQSQRKSEKHEVEKEIEQDLQTTCFYLFFSSRGLFTLNVLQIFLSSQHLLCVYVGGDSLILNFTQHFSTHLFEGLTISVHCRLNNIIDIRCINIARLNAQIYF